MATHSSTLAWRIPGTGEPGGLPSMGSLSCIGEGNGNPLQCSCLENPRDGGAWCAAVYGVAQSRTRLKWLSSSSSSVSEPLNHWHLGLNNSFLWGAVLCIIGYLAASLASYPTRYLQLLKNVSRYCQMSHGSKITSTENHWCRIKNLAKSGDVWVPILSSPDFVACAPISSITQ